MEQQVQWFMEQIRLSKRKQFGVSSEQTKIEQLNLFNEDEETHNLAVSEPQRIEVKTHYRKRTRLTTDKLPADLPMEVIEHKLPEKDSICPDCGGELHTMGKETRDELKVIPAKAVIVRHIRHVYSCRNCEKTSDHTPIVKAEIPEPVIKGSFASPETIAHIATQKFMMGSPLYRQEQEWKQNGIEISRQTMSNWLIKACEDWLEAIYEEMKKRLWEHEVLHVDETVVQVLKEPGKAAQSKSYMWLYRTSGEAKHQIILYDYQPDRKHIHPEEFLKEFSGYLHADGYNGYYKLSEKITVIGCWAHVRRKFFEAMEALPKEKQATSNAAKGVTYCEKQFALLCPENRLKEREKQSKPIIGEFYDWVGKLNVLPKTHLG